MDHRQHEKMYHMGSGEARLGQGLFSISLVTWVMNKQSDYLEYNTRPGGCK